ncbi:BA14K family protein [Brevundimonas sp.]|uniref:BA14K family protein n=1 Tax=Brevundimonas sp. TaxID=1871086 RepID=UPI0025F4912F|nr:BA14K family protein [Brevundimonas sp.]
MREIMLAATLVGAAALLTPERAEAQTWRDQLGVPGDFRCDAYWDRGRDDCDAAWRTQYLRQGWRRDWSRDWGRDRWAGYGRHDRYDGGYRGYERSYGYGHGSGSGHGYGWPHEPRPTHPPTPYRDPERIHWCEHRFRSYDPHTGYYLGYSGHYRFCG